MNVEVKNWRDVDKFSDIGKVLVVMGEDQEIAGRLLSRKKIVEPEMNADWDSLIDNPFGHPDNIPTGRSIVSHVFRFEGGDMLSVRRIVDADGV